jgi:flagellar biosynthesis/type III secretory pathway protein FliH
MRAMSETSLEAVLRELGYTEKWEARGLERGLEKGLERGLQRGLERGLRKGLEKGQERAVRRLQKHGMDPTQIAEFLELPQATVFRYITTE